MQLVGRGVVDDLRPHESTSGLSSKGGQVKVWCMSSDVFVILLGLRTLGVYIVSYKCELTLL